MNKYDSVIIHYDEIGIKGKNRTHFEKLLMKNIQIKVKEIIKDIFRESGQITILFD